MTTFPKQLFIEPKFIDLGVRDYAIVWEEMKAFTNLREKNIADQFWLVEHPPVYTQGQAGKPEHVLRDTGIPIVRTDRGGQVTYHGPGQIVIYTLCDLKRCGIGVRGFVDAIENAIIELLADYGVTAKNRADAPGVYVGDSKIAALGLRVRKGCSYHGLALNVDMDLAPFEDINPCGYAGLSVTRTLDHGITDSSQVIATRLYQKLLGQLYPSNR